MAAVANRIYDARPQGCPVHAVQQIAASDRAEVGRPPSPAGHRRQASCRDGSRRGGSRRRDEGSDSNGLCFYHHNFGARASQCQSPCGWPGNGLAADGLGN
jgi:hypothetical protein